jgi:hypothetical protein
MTTQKQAVSTDKHPGGRPTKYNRRFCRELIDFFDIEPYEEREVKTQDRKTGREYIDYKDHANDLPTFERFAHNIGVNGDTLVEWAKTVWPEGHKNAGKLRHPEFSAAYTRAKELQKDILITNGLQGLYQTTFAIFLAKNITDLKDRQEITGADGTPLMPISLDSVILSRMKQGGSTPRRSTEDS